MSGKKETKSHWKYICEVITPFHFQTSASLTSVFWGDQEAVSLKCKEPPGTEDAIYLSSKIYLPRSPGEVVNATWACELQGYAQLLSKRSKKLSFTRYRTLQAMIIYSGLGTYREENPAFPSFGVIAGCTGLHRIKDFTGFLVLQIKVQYLK